MCQTTRRVWRDSSMSFTRGTERASALSPMSIKKTAAAWTYLLSMVVSMLSIAG